MKSPFPGMDPYLERHWLDVHGRLVAYSTDQLNRRLPDDLIARMEERLLIDAPEEEYTHGVRPDVRVFRPGWSEPETGGIAIVAPIKLVVDLEPVKQRSVRILRADDEQLITVVEFLSPSNKIGRGVEKYRQKRDELLEAGVSVVEIDLNRQGDWREVLRPHTWTQQEQATYRATVRPSREPQAAYVFPLPLGEVLRPIPIPLRDHDPEVMLDLQPLIEDAYRNGRYSQTIDYSRPLDPPLSDGDAALAAELIEAAGRRRTMERS